ncbi:odorant receptor 13a-like [Vespa velutina]|uniref:odorant receptor 13a-like n=1 Tax=Vespa velutina TaxID=202808 RepID=UPI001FB4659B|nr:odorant receptor 13a-like [Vespa velutina]
MEGTKEGPDLTDTLKAITWSKRLLAYSGIWPLEIRNSLFLPFSFYGCLYSILGFLDLADRITDFHYVLTNIMENMLMFLTMTKFGLCRVKYRSISRFLIETENDYVINSYKTEEERMIFMKYNRFAIRMILIMIPLMTFVLLTHYFNAVIPNVLMVMANSSVEYKLPYKIRPLLKPSDVKRYVFGCIHEFVGIILVLSAYVGTDCLLTSSGFHLTGQLAVLKCKVKEILNDTDGSQRVIQKIILRHYHLIRLADILEDSFNMVMFLHLLGSTILICTSSYQMLVSLAVLEKVYIFTFVVYVFHLSITVFVYCYMGECLIEESTTLCEEFYHCDWYELSTNDLKSICLCMIRARKPLQLTCGKFCAVSLCTFTDILKSSMAYLSVVRTMV